MSNQNLLKTLIDPSSEGFEASWTSFFLDADRVRALGAEITPELATALLAAGQKWLGSGWNTSKASKTLYSLTQVPFVKGVWSEYRNCFLYALALFWEVEVAELELSERAADASYALRNVFAGYHESSQVAYSPVHQGEVPGSNPAVGSTFSQEEPDEDTVQLSWDEPQLLLPPELVFIWSGVQSGERKLDLKQVLGQYPRFAQFPAAAPTKNHRADGLSKTDKKEKAWQQTLLHALRMLATVYGQVQPEVHPGCQQLFQLLAELYMKIEGSRKEASLPGSMGPSGEVLFDKSEIQAAMQRQKINRFGRGIGICPPKAYGRHFSTTGRGFGAGKGMPYAFGFGRGFSKGFGKAPFYRRPWGPKGGKGRGIGSAMLVGLASQLQPVGPIPPLKADPPPAEPECFLSSCPKLPSMVEKKCIPRSASFAPRRSSLSNKSLRKFVLPSSIQIAGRHPSCKKHLVGVCSSRCCKATSFNGKYKAFGSLVYHKKAGQRQSQTSTYCRLQGAQSAFSAQSLQIGPSPPNFSIPAQRSIGRKNRPQTCIFSHRVGPSLKKVRPHGGRRSNLGVSGRLFRPQCFARVVYESDENLSKKVAATGHNVLHLPRRHFGPRDHCQPGCPSSGHNDGRFGSQRNANKSRQIDSVSNTKRHPFGIHVGLKEWLSPSACRKAQKCQKRVGQIGRQKLLDNSKNGCHSRSSSLLLNRLALFTGIHGPNGTVFAKKIGS